MMEVSDEAARAQAIDDLPAHLRPVVAAACAERMMYPAWATRSGARTAEGLRILLAQLWSDLCGERMTPEEVAARLDAALELVPPEGTDVYADSLTVADATVVVAYALQARQSEETRDVVMAARTTSETIALRAEQRAMARREDGGLGKNITVEGLRADEFARQRRDIEELGAVGTTNPAKVITAIRERARRASQRLSETQLGNGKRSAPGMAAGLAASVSVVDHRQVALPFGVPTTPTAPMDPSPHGERPPPTFGTSGRARPSSGGGANRPLEFVRAQPTSLTVSEVVAAGAAIGLTFSERYVQALRGQKAARERTQAGQRVPVELPPQTQHTQVKTEFVTSRPEMSVDELLVLAKTHGLRMSADFVLRVRGALTEERLLTPARGTTPTLEGVAPQVQETGLSERGGGAAPEPRPRQEMTFRTIAAALGLKRAYAILDEEKERLRNLPKT